ncbi:MAG: hypothetical protein R6U89_05885 [Dehalococcoidia bacterium]
MITWRILVIALVIAGLFVLPATSAAQPEVCGYYGSVTLDGQSVDNGTEVKAWVDGTLVASTITTGDQYDIKVAGDYEGKSVSFTVGPDDAAAEVAQWIKGDNIKLNLNGISGSSPPAPPAKDASISLNPDHGLVTKISAQGFTPGATVTITMGNAVAGDVVAGPDGSFTTTIVSPILEAGTYSIVAIDPEDRSDEASFSVPDLRGAQGPQGAQGPAGPEGPKGGSGGVGLAIASLIIAIIAIILSVLVIVRVGPRWRRRV